jgi:hypothetical protein
MMRAASPEAGDHEVAGDDEVAAHLEAIIRRVKQSMNYRGSYSTRDILGSLVARWLQSGEWERLKLVPAEQRHLGESVRRFILDRFDQLRRRGERVDAQDLFISLPDEVELLEIIELAELREWIVARVGELELGRVDDRVRVRLRDPVEVGRALRLHLAEHSQRDIARMLGISLGLVNKRIVDGTRYLVVLRSIECGLA